MNISATGLQFSTDEKIDLEIPVRLVWEDPHHGTIQPTMHITRELQDSTQVDSHNIYGATFAQLEPDVKEKLKSLLDSLHETAVRSSQRQMKSVTIEMLFQALDEGRTFLKKSLINNETLPEAIQMLVDDMADYEKAAFSSEKPESTYLQKLAALNFSFGLLGKMAPKVGGVANLKGPFLQRVVKCLQEWNDINRDLESFRSSLDERNMDPEEKTTILKRINESSSRAFYNRQSLLQLIATSVPVGENESMEVQTSYRLIRAEHENFQGEGNENLGPSIESPAPERKNEASSSGSLFDKFIDLIVATNIKFTKFSIILVLTATFIIMVIIASYGGSWLLQKWKSSKIAWEIGASVKMLDVKAHGNQVDIIVDSSEWRRLAPNEKDRAQKQIRAYLKKYQDSNTAVIMEKTGRPIEVIFESR